MKRFIVARLASLVILAPLAGGCEASSAESFEAEELDSTDSPAQLDMVPGAFGPDSNNSVAKSSSLSLTTPPSLCLRCGPLPEPWAFGPLPEPWSDSSSGSGNGGGGNGGSGTSTSGNGKPKDNNGSGNKP